MSVRARSRTHAARTKLSTGVPPADQCRMQWRELRPLSAPPQGMDPWRSTLANPKSDRPKLHQEIGGVRIQRNPCCRLRVYQADRFVGGVPTRPARCGLDLCSQAQAEAHGTSPGSEPGAPKPRLVDFCAGHGRPACPTSHREPAELPPEHTRGGIRIRHPPRADTMYHEHANTESLGRRGPALPRSVAGGPRPGHLPDRDPRNRCERPGRPTKPTTCPPLTQCLSRLRAPARKASNRATPSARAQGGERNQRTDARGVMGAARSRFLHNTGC